MLLNTRKRDLGKFNPGLSANRPSNNWALFIALYKIALTLESVDQIPQRDHLNESLAAALSCCSIIQFKHWKVVLILSSFTKSQATNLKPQIDTPIIKKWTYS